MGKGAVKAMHGYHPSDSGSNGMLLSNQQLPAEVDTIMDLAPMLEKAAVWANHGESHEAAS